MPCCASSAIPKTSQHGTQFFAHSRVENCTGTAESAEHLYCKTLIAQAALAAGWTVVTEKGGVSPSGEAWVADVFCERGSAKVVFEVQISPQKHNETRRRQQRYQESGIRSAWFFGPKLRRDVVFSDHATPIFALSEFEPNSEPTIEKHGGPLSQFVETLLSKRLVWTKYQASKPFYLGYIEEVCGKCKCSSKLAYVFSETLADPEHMFFSDPVTAESVGTALRRMHETITNDELEYRGFSGVVTVHKWRGQVEYVNFFCQRCRVTLSNPDLAKRVNLARRAAALCSVSEDGEVIRHPLNLELIDRNTDKSGYWAILPLASTTPDSSQC